MNFVDLSIQFQAEVTEEDPGAASNIAPEERPNHPCLEQMWVILYSRPSGIVLEKHAGMMQGIQARLEASQEETKAKIQSLQEKADKARDESKARLEKRIAELKAEQKRRTEQLKQARQQIKETLEA